MHLNYLVLGIKLEPHECQESTLSAELHICLDKEVIKGKYIFQNRKGCHELSAEGKDAFGVAKRKELKSLKKFQTERKTAQIQNLICTNYENFCIFM